MRHLLLRIRKIKPLHLSSKTWMADEDQELVVLEAI